MVRSPWKSLHDPLVGHGPQFVNPLFRRKYLWIRLEFDDIEKPTKERERRYPENDLIFILGIILILGTGVALRDKSYKHPDNIDSAGKKSSTTTRRRSAVVYMVYDNRAADRSSVL